MMVYGLVEIYISQQPIAFICTLKSEAEGSSKMLANFYHTTRCQTTEDGNLHSNTAMRISNFMKCCPKPQHGYHECLGITASTQLLLLSAAHLQLTPLFNLSCLQTISKHRYGAQKYTCYQPCFYMAGNSPP